MAFDREKILTTAQKYVDKKKYDRAIVEYQKIVQQDPNDARTLLKLGDLQARMNAYAEAIATYDRVGQYYSTQGFALKAIAVYKQIRELIQKHVPQLADRYGHIVPRLAETYQQLGLTSDALAAYDEVATRLQRSGRDREAIDVFEKMVSLDATNPLPHLRLAEARCRVQSIDEAIDAFWSAAELLMQLKRPEDALKVVERILHFRQEPKYARVAAELYLDKGTKQDGLQALAKLQVCFQADPKDLATLGLLARAFTVIGQAPKAIEVQKEMARIAKEQGRQELFDELATWLLKAAPDDEQVQALARMRVSEPPPPIVGPDSIPPNSRHLSQPPPELAPESVDGSDLEVDELLDEDELEELDAPRPFMGSAPDVVVVDEEVEVIEERYSTTQTRGHVRKAIVDAESFRGLRLYSKAVETLHIALELEPASIELREKLRDILVDSGNRDAAIGEMVSIATLYMQRGDNGTAETLLYQVLEAEPEHPEACDLLDQLEGYSIGDGVLTDDTTTQVEVVEAVGRTGHSDTDREATAERFAAEPYDPDAPLPSYDLEGVSTTRAFESGPPSASNEPTLDDPFEEGGRRAGGTQKFEEVLDDELDEFGDFEDLDDTELEEAPIEPPPEEDDSALSGLSSAVEEALDEADFFASRELYEDARMILIDQLDRAPGNPLLMERLRELDAIVAASARSRPESDVPEDDGAFDIAASLDALDEAVATVGGDQPSFSNPTEEVDVDQVFAKFKEGVRAQVEDTDSATHYDLGVAYKEMGLSSDAITEFEIAARDPIRECMAFAMVAMIHLEQNQHDAAAEAYVRALGAAQKTVEQELSLYYDLGHVNELKGSRDEALYYFQKINRRDPGFRDVRARVQALEVGKPQEKPALPSGDSDDFDKAFDDLFD